MSIEHPEKTRVNIPDTMEDYHEHEVELAREIQARFAEPLEESTPNETETVTMPLVQETEPQEVETTRTSRYTKRQKAAAAIGTLLLSVSAAIGIKAAIGGEDTIAPLEKDPVAGADVVPGNAVPSVEASPSVEAPVEPEVLPVEPVEPSAEPTDPASATPENSPAAEVAIEDINRDPSPEALESSLQPVTVADHTPEQALSILMNNLKLYWLSGDLGSIDTSDIYSPESVELGERQFDNIFGPEEFRDTDRLLVGWLQDTRNHLTDNLDYYNKEFGYAEDSTFNSTFEVLSSENYNGDEIFYTIRNEWNSNIHELNTDQAPKNSDKESYVIDRIIGINQHNGNYHISYVGFADPADIAEIEK